MGVSGLVHPYSMANQTHRWILGMHACEPSNLNDYCHQSMAGQSTIVLCI